MLIFPVLATVGFLFLLMHKSEFPAVFNRYSINYSILLILSGLNLGLLWRKSMLHVSYQRVLGRFTCNGLVAFVVLVLSVTFLIDLVGRISVQFTLSDSITLGLLGVLIFQVEALRTEPIFLSIHLALLASSVVLTVILLELIFVFFLFQSRIPKHHREFRRLMPHLEAGPQPICAAKSPGTFRILGLADSFGMWGGRSNYHYVLEDILRRHVLPTIQMVNISLPAYDTLLELAILRRFGMAYSPDLVLHGFFAGNDFDLFGDSVEVYNYLGIPVYRFLGTFRYRPRNFLVRAWLEAALKRLQEGWRRHNESEVGVVDKIGAHSKSSFLKLQFDRMNGWAMRTERDLRRMHKVFPVLDAIRAVVENGGARYVMVIHPDPTQVDNTLRRELIATFAVNEDDYDFDLPQTLLRSYCARERIHCLDLLPVFREKARDFDLFPLRDPHYNRAGHELAAASISTFLRDRQLVPDTGRKTSLPPNAE